MAAVEGIGSKAISVILAFLIVFAPLFRGGHQPLALALIEISSILLFLAVIWNRDAWLHEDRNQLIGLMILILLPLLYLIPIPGNYQHLLPGRELYMSVLHLIKPGEASGTFHWSLVPFATEQALLKLIPPIAVFIAVKCSDATSIIRLVHLIIAVTVFQALLGLLQYGTGIDGMLYFGSPSSGSARSTGTYLNPNHLAGLCEMLLPVIVGLLVVNLGHGVPKRSRRRWRERFTFFGSYQGNKVFWYATCAVIVMLGTVFSRSRAGIALIGIGIAMVTLLFSRRLGGNNVFGTTGTLIAMVVGFSLSIGLVPVFDRFSVAGLEGDARWQIFSQTSLAILQHLPFGVGPGTFQDVISAYQPIELGQWVINRAHNDYLEWILEAGVLALALMIFLLGLFVMRWREIWGFTEWTKEKFVQVGAGVGITLVLLHEMVDYNLRNPANMVYFAFMAAVFFHRHLLVSRRHQPSRSGRASVVMAEGYTTSSTSTMPATKEVTAEQHKGAPDQIRNPFLD